MVNIYNSVLGFYPEVANVWELREVKTPWRTVIFEIKQLLNNMTVDYDQVQAKYDVSKDDFDRFINKLIDKKIIRIEEGSSKIPCKKNIVIIASASRVSKFYRSCTDAEKWQKGLLTFIEEQFFFDIQDVKKSLMEYQNMEEKDIKNGFATIRRLGIIRKGPHGNYLAVSINNINKYIDKKTEAYDNICNVLNTYPEFQIAKQFYLDSDEVINIRGENVPDEIEVILSLVKKLYASKGLTCKHLSDIARCMKNADNDGMNFFDIVNAKCWVDIMSALEYNLHIFSKGSTSFEDFLSNYTDLYSLLNNRSYEAFYVRWLSEVCAAYTVYRKETSSEFDRVLKIWKATHKDAQSRLCNGRSRFDDINNPRRRDYLRVDIINVIDMNENVIESMNAYITKNPEKFVYEINKIRGTVNLWNVLLEYPCFSNGLEGYISKKKNSKNKEIDYMVYLVKSMHQDMGKPFSENSFRLCLINATERGGSFFDTDKSTQWINIMSALNYHFDIFADEGEYNFNIFYKNYKRLYSKLNNSKTLAFYARNLSDILAMYTVYIKGTAEDYNEMMTGRYNFKKALEIAQKKVSATDRHRASSTYSIEHYLISEIFQDSTAKNKEETLAKLSKYILGNPFYFSHVGGQQKHRYRRFYCATHEMLKWIENRLENHDVSFTRPDLIEIFNSRTASYRVKDEYVEDLEGYLLNEAQKYLTDSDLISINPEFLIEKNACVSDEGIGVGDDCHDQSKEEIVDSIMRMLRLYMAMILLKKELKEISDHYSISKKEMIKEINGAMIELGLQQFPSSSYDYGNECSLQDLCIVKFIEQEKDFGNY